LSKLLEREIKFSFDEACTKAFECLMEKLTSTPVIIAPDRSEPSEVMYDVSGVAMRETQQDILPNILCTSKALNGAQKNYTVIE